jgi:hypothetical protein
MATTYDTQIQQLYVAYFNRPADTAGLAFWEGVVAAANGDTSAVSAAFAASTEYKAAYANMTNSAIVSAVYQNLFGHAPDAAGLKFWADNMDAGKLTIDAVVAAVSQGALGTDATIFSNKVTAAATFTAALDTPSEQKGYTGDKANVLAKAFIAGVTDDASLSASIDPATLNAAVGKVVAASGVFSIADALASYDAAANAEVAFLKTVDDGDGDATTHTADAAKVASNLTDAIAAVELKLGANASVYDAGSDAVKAALVSDQMATNAAALVTAQGHLATANANIAAVAGLKSAIDTLSADKALATSAHTAATAADTALNVQKASFGVTAGGAAVITAPSGTTDGTIVAADGTTVATIKAATGLATISTSITASDYVGLTTLVSAYNADITANSAATKADAAVTTAQLNVNHLDSTSTEAASLVIVTNDIKADGDVTIATGAQATEAQIATEIAILTAKSAAGDGAATTALNTLNGHVTTYHNDAATNPLVAALGDSTSGATKEVNDAAKAISDFTKAIATLSTAQANVAALAGYDAAISAASDLFATNHYTLTDLDTQSGVAIAGADSDVFVVGSTPVNTISLFNLQGTDSLFIGTGYTLNKGALSTGNDAVLEAFVGSDASGNATITLESHAFSSHVSATAGETVTITLVGVDASTIQLDSNGIITAGPHA